MTAVFAPNKTSAKLLVDFAAKTWGIGVANVPVELQRRYLMVYDLYIKARSYALINKVSFWLAIMAGILVLAWPSIAVISKDYGVEREFLESAIVQTTVTGLAALMFAIYSHYKKRQTYMENLMRYIIFSEEVTGSLVEKVMVELERVDSGFAFSEAVMKKSNKSEARTESQQ